MELIISLAILGVLTGAVLQISQLMIKTQNEGSFKIGANMIKQDLISTVSRQASWDQSVKQIKNLSMACLRSNTCKNGDGGTFSLYDAQGNLVYDALNSKMGFTSSGLPCNTFTSAGNDACPLRVNLSWRASCNDTVTPGSCKNPQEVVSLQFDFKPKTVDRRFAFNPGNYGVTSGRLNLKFQTPVVACALKQHVFVGPSTTFNGVSADVDGCVPISAFVGPIGPQGPPGPPGPCT